MDKKKCPQCKNLILVVAPTCLYCGRPNKFATNNYVKSKWNKNYKYNNINIFKKAISRKTLFIIIVILIIFIIFILCF